jgi:phosphoribosylformimino-5-aminoimidazole carboxamide ribonucleotide (ProFAR) isomerase
MSDVEALMATPSRNILGVVIGRALYDGRIDSTAALQRARMQ